VFRNHQPLAALLSCALLAASPARAADDMKLYDNFNVQDLDPVKWPGYQERVREVTGKKLRLKARDYASTANDIETTGTSHSQLLAKPNKLTAIRATIRVNAIEMEACATNPAISQVRARVLGQFFNTGIPTPGSSLNDVSAQLRVYRVSNSADPANTLRVAGLVVQCNDADCIDTTQIGTASLGTVTIGGDVTVEMEWDKAGSRFLFSRDGGTPAAVNYAVLDGSPAGEPLALIGVRNFVLNCTASPRPSGMIDATFDNVYVNKAAVP
jgi:hypothetical protein